MPGFKKIHPAAPAAESIVVAGCETMADMRAMARWILPVLQEWPKAAWHVWLTDATNCRDIKAAKLGEDPDAIQWRTVQRGTNEDDDTVCRILAGRAGLVIFAHDVIASAAARMLDGLVAGIACFPASDPLAKPFKGSFASFGVTAGM